MPEFLDRFEANGFILRVLPGNLPAMALYRRLGFQTSFVHAVQESQGRAVRVIDIEMTLVPNLRPVEFVDLLSTSLLSPPDGVHSGE